MPNVMATLPNIGGALCLTPQSWADAHYQSAVHYTAKTRNPLKLAGVPQTPEAISAAGPTFTILSEHVEEVLLFNKFFSDCRYVYLHCEDIARQSCAMVPRWQFLASCFFSEPTAARFRPAS